MNPEQPAPLPTLAPSNSKRKSRYPSKTCKYAGVTFRASRDKYQARIYKGNKEYNLGLFDVSADAALAYDVAHRLVKKISAALGKEKEALESYESNKDAPDWLDYGDDASTNTGLDLDKLNFLRPLDFKAERERELEESRGAAGSQKHEHCPKLEELRGLVTKEAIRVVKIIVGAIDGGTNNYRRKRKKANAAMKDGVVQEGAQDGAPKNPPKKKKKSKESTASSGNSKVVKKEPADAAPVWVPEHGQDLHPNLGQSYQANNEQMLRGMGKSTLQAIVEDNSTKAAMFINNQSNAVENLMNKMLNDRLPHHPHGDADGSGNAQLEKPSRNHTVGSNESHSFFAQDTTQAGNANSYNQKKSDFNFMGMLGAMSGYPVGVGMGGGSGYRNTDAAAGMSGNNNDINSLQTPENYHEFFKNMRNSFPGLGAVPARGGMGPPPSVGSQNSIPEEFQRMMLARAVGQSGGTHNPGMHHAGMGSMMGADIPSSLNQGNHYSNGFIDPETENSIKQLEHYKSMMQNSLDRSVDGAAPPCGMDEPRPNNLHPGQISPTTLNMFRAGGYFSSQGNSANYNGDGGVTHEQLAAMYGGDRFGQQQRAPHSSHLFAGLNYPSGFSGQFGSGGGRGLEGAEGRSPYRSGSQLQMSRSVRQEAYFQSFAAGQAANLLPDPNVPYGGGEAHGNPTLDDMRQLFGLPRSLL